MADLFLKAVERIDSDLSEQRDQFIKYYISIELSLIPGDLAQKIVQRINLGSG